MIPHLPVLLLAFGPLAASSPAAPPPVPTGMIHVDHALVVGMIQEALASGLALLTGPTATLVMHGEEVERDLGRFVRIGTVRFAQVPRQLGVGEPDHQRATIELECCVDDGGNTRVSYLSAFSFADQVVGIMDGLALVDDDTQHTIHLVHMETAYQGFVDDNRALRVGIVTLMAHVDRHATTPLEAYPS